MTLEDVPVLFLLPIRNGFILAGPSGATRLGLQWWVNAWVKSNMFGECLCRALQNPTQELA